MEKSRRFLDIEKYDIFTRNNSKNLSSMETNERTSLRPS